MFALKIQICSKAVYIVRNNWNITQILHLPLCNFLQKKHQVVQKMHSAEQSCEEIHQTHIRTSQPYTCFHLSRRHSLHQKLQLSLLTEIHLLPSFHKKSQAENLLMFTATSKVQVFFKVRCHIYCSIYVFLHNLTCLKCPNSNYNRTECIIQGKMNSYYCMPQRVLNFHRVKMLETLYI